MQVEAPVLGLALGGGAVRGLAHLGVLRAFERSSLQPDVICGTSSGAIIAGAFASGMSANDLIAIAVELRWNDLLRVSVRRNRVFDPAGLDELITSVIPAVDFDNLRLAFASIAQDRATGERVVLRRGDPRRAAAASAAIRGAFPPVPIDGRLLMDGIDVDPVPGHAARELGASYVVGIDVLRSTVIRRVRVRSGRHTPALASGADLTITPALESRSAWDFSGAAEIIALGESAAVAAIPLIERDLARRACGT